MRGHARRVLGFATLPLLAALAPLVLLPLVSDRFGAAGWTAIAVGQSVGGLASYVVGLTWALIGGNLIAQTPDPEERASIFRRSIHSRAIALLITVLPALAVVILLRPERLDATVTFMIATTLNGFTAGWYFAGAGTPGRLIINEGLLRLAGYAVAVSGILFGADLLWYAGCLVVSALAMITMNWISICGFRTGALSHEWRAGLGDFRHQIHGTMSKAIQSAFYFGQTSIFGFVSPVALTTFAAADQIQKALYNAASFWPTSFVNWIGGATDADTRRRRGIRLLLLTTAFAIIATALWALIGPDISRWLFASKAGIGWGVCFLIGLAVALNGLVRTIELLVFIPAGRQSLVYRISFWSSIVGLAVFTLASWVWGVTGGLVAGCLTPAAALIAYLSCMRNRLGMVAEQRRISEGA